MVKGDIEDGASCVDVDPSMASRAAGADGADADDLDVGWGRRRRGEDLASGYGGSNAKEKS